MSKKQFKQTLYDIAAMDVPVDLDLWSSLQNQLENRQHPLQQLLRQSYLQLGRIALVFTVLLISGATAYAISPAFRALLQMDPTLEKVETSNLGQPLNISQKIGDTTVSLIWAYADANRIALVYTINTPNGNPLELEQIVLDDKVGTNFVMTVGMGTNVEIPELSEVKASLNEEGYVVSFDASPVSGSYSNLELHLEMMLKDELKKEVVGPVVFDFSVPFHFGSVLEIAQTVTFRGVPVTLEQINITPSDTTALICFDDPQDGYSDWLPLSSILAKSETEDVQARAFNQSDRDESGCSLSHYYPGLYDAHADSWTITITELLGFDLDNQVTGEEPAQIRLTGPWIFEFELP